MGQYWKAVNLDKREYLDPHKMDSGAKLWEQLAAPSVGQALVILCAAQREARGAGDLDMDINWHGPEREFPQHDACGGPMPSDYPAIAMRTIGRWAGNRVAFVGDYAQDSDLPGSPYATSKIYECTDNGDWTDVSDDVLAVIAHELSPVNA